jgi:hypothetical protein
MSDTVDDVMNSIQESVPEDVVVEESTVVSGDAPVETPEEETPEEEAPEEEAPVEASVESSEEEAPVEASVESSEEEAPVEAPVEEASVESSEEEAPVEAPVEASVESSEEEAPEEAPVEAQEEKPMEQVVSDIRDILSEDPAPVTESSESSELTDDLKQRIAELDYLRECCGNWVGSGRAGKRNFLTAWQNKNVSVGATVNYEDTLVKLEKLPEIVKLWAEGKVKSNSNHFKNIQSYTLDRSLFNEKSVTEKVEVVEQLIDLLTDCANEKMRVTQIEEVIDNLY